MASQTIGSDFTDGALLPKYVNGRLLVAEDLATSQATLLARDARIGQAAGTGVVNGLWVTAGATALTVGAGVGISPSGQPVTVPRSITLPLSSTPGTTTRGGAAFKCCNPVNGNTGIASGTYLLTARPVQRTQGMSPMAPAPDSTVSPGCVARWTAEGVELRAITLPIPATVAGRAVTDDNRRNLTAHWCFGTEQLANLPIFPFTFNPAYSGFDSLSTADLTDVDVPLAVFRRSETGVVDLDNWAARRRITTPDPVPSAWSAVTADRRDADGQARFLQFQDQIDQISTGGWAGRAQASTTFGLLPPVGFLPTSRLSSDLGSSATQATRFVGSVFNPWDFFEGLASFGGVIPWGLADFALRQSWQLPAVNTASVGEGPAILTFYWIQESVDAGQYPQYVVFTTDLPWQGDNIPRGGGTLTTTVTTAPTDKTG